MKKKVLSALLVLMMSVLCLGCGKDKEVDQPVTDTQKVVEDTQKEEPKVEVQSQTKVEDEKVLAAVKGLLLAEQKLYFHLSCEWTEYVDLTKEYKFKGHDGVYYLVTEEGATSWAYYENQAKEIYSAEYVEKEFNPMYENVYLEKNGKLYRALADGVGTPIVEDSIEIFENTEGRYYVSVFERNASEEFETARIIEIVEGSKYGFLISESIGYVK